MDRNFGRGYDRYPNMDEPLGAVTTVTPVSMEPLSAATTITSEWTILSKMDLARTSRVYRASRQCPPYHVWHQLLNVCSSNDDSENTRSRWCWSPCGWDCLVSRRPLSPVSQSGEAGSHLPVDHACFEAGILNSLEALDHVANKTMYSCDPELHRWSVFACFQRQRLIA